MRAKHRNHTHMKCIRALYMAETSRIDNRATVCLRQGGVARNVADICRAQLARQEVVQQHLRERVQ